MSDFSYQGASYLNKKQLNSKKRNHTNKGNTKHTAEDEGHAANYVFFWRSNSPFSQWYSCSFTENDIVFSCAEQYMMYHKALLFSDQTIADKILTTNDPKTQKELGRRVSNFDSKKWDSECQEIVYRGNKLKFSQNQKLYDTMMNEKFMGREFVEASPVDSVWGIGLDVEKAKKISPSQWKGKNYLGKVLTRVRDDFLVNPIQSF
jgi:ribA/ribD-fused uncharacterized protein